MTASLDVDIDTLIAESNGKKRIKFKNKKL